MKKLLYSAIVFSFLFVSCKSEKKQEQAKNTSTEVTAQTFEATHLADVSKSKVLWEGFKPTGSHNGTIALKDAKATYTKDVLKGIQVEIDMTSLVILDMPADDPYYKKLADHLLSPDFFDVPQFPIATFSATSVESTKEGHVQVTGDITIKGITKSISFPASVKQEANTIQFKAEAFKIDRTDFGIKYKSKNFFDNLKDKFINDEFEIALDLVFVKK